jgi:hypothetical protein
MGTGATAMTKSKLTPVFAPLESETFTVTW